MNVLVVRHNIWWFRTTGPTEVVNAPYRHSFFCPEKYTLNNMPLSTILRPEKYTLNNMPLSTILRPEKYTLNNMPLSTILLPLNLFTC